MSLDRLPLAQPDGVLQTVYRACWAATRFLEASVDGDYPLAQSTCEAFVQLFLFLPDEEQGLEGRCFSSCITRRYQTLEPSTVKDVILQGLVFTSRDILQTVLQSSFAKIDVKLKLEDSKHGVSGKRDALLTTVQDFPLHLGIRCHLQFAYSLY